VRVARQQDFLRDLREQISPENASGRSTRREGRGHAISSTFRASASELIELTKLVASRRPSRCASPVPDDELRHDDRRVSFVTSDPELEEKTLQDFLHATKRWRSRAQRGKLAPPQLALLRRGPGSVSDVLLRRAGSAAGRRQRSFRCCIRPCRPAWRPSSRFARTRWMTSRGTAPCYVVVWQENEIAATTTSRAATG